MFSPTENRRIALKDTEKLVQVQKSDKDFWFPPFADFS